jgi:hypothetical protein
MIICCYGLLALQDNIYDACVATIDGVVMLLWDSGLYGIIFMDMCVYCCRFFRHS